MYCKLLKEKFNCWEELEKEIGKIKDNKEKGDVFEEFTFAYFLLNSDLYEIAEIYMAEDIPQEIKERLKLEKTDHGVDGVIITYDNKLIAYQVKFRSDRSSPSYKELSTFWTESEYADYRCIISNCFELISISDKKKHQFTILIDQLLKLDDLFFSKIHLLTNKNEILEVEKFTPKPHQEKMIEEVLSGFKDSNRGKLIAACASGKTLTSLWILEQLNSAISLFVVPNLALIKQTLKQWTEQAESPFTFICVCSDYSVVDKSIDYDQSDIKASHLGIPVTTDPADIQMFLSKETDKRKVVFSTYQSLDAIVNAIIELDDFAFDFGVFDEAHRTAGMKVSELFIFGVNDEYIPIRKRLFMTATERVVSPRIKKYAENTEYDIFSMDDEAVYGKTFTYLNFGDAIEQDIITDYKIVLCGISEEEVADLVEENYYIAFGKGNFSTSENLFKQVILAKTMHELESKKTITFHRTIENAMSFIHGSNRKEFSFQNVLDNVAPEIEEKDILISHINGSMSAGQRNQIFHQFEKSKFGLITNARCLTEGVDVPIIDAIYFADPKNSIIDIIQAVGRALRKSKQKETGFSYIIIPIIISSDIKTFEEIETTQFDTLHSVIQALRDQDQALAELIDELNLSVAKGTYKKSKKGNKLNNKLTIILPPHIDIENFSNGIDLRIAEVNKNPIKAKRTLAISEGPKARKSGMKRKFRTIGDYNIKAYIDNLVLPTLDFFKSDNDQHTNKELKFSHNNVSHTQKIGAIIKTKQLYHMSLVGKELIANRDSYEALFQEQLLKYAEYDVSSGDFLFPYRASLTLFQNFQQLSRFEFLYSLYSLQGSTDDDIKDAVDKILYLRETYPNIEVLSEENKKRVLSLINTKFNSNFNFKDVWTSRTTAYNQFNYFKKHLWCIENVFLHDTRRKEYIIKSENANPIITDLLAQTQDIENIESFDEYIELYSNCIFTI